MRHMLGSGVAVVLGLAAAAGADPIAFNLGGTGIDYVKDIATDSAGNFIAAGYFSGTVDFDPGAGSYALTAVGGTDNFIAKYGPAGNLLWATRSGGSGVELPHSVVTDLAGNIYTAGYFSGTTDFDPGAGVAARTSAGLRDIYVAKYSPTGAYNWVVTAGSNAAVAPAVGDEGFDLRVDAAGNVALTGIFEGTINAGGSDLVSAGGQDVFLARYDSAGQHLWSRSFGSAGDDQGYAVAADSAGNVYLTGAFTNTVNFGGSNLTASGSTNCDIFLAKLDSAGNHIWSERMGGTLTDRALPGGLEVREISGQTMVFLSGNFQGIADMDPGAAVSTLTSTRNAASAYTADLYVARFDGDGNLVWARAAGGTGLDGAHRMTIDDAGNVYFTGYFSGETSGQWIDFDPGSGSALLQSLAGGGATDIFVAKLDAAGNYVWAEGFAALLSGSEFNALGGGIELDAFGNLFVAGRMYGSIDVDPGGGQWLLTSSGSSDGFVIRLNSDGQLVGVPEPAALSLLAGAALLARRRRQS